MSDLAKKILRDEKASDLLNDIVHGRSKDKNGQKNNDLEFEGKIYKVEFVDR